MRKLFFTTGSPFARAVRIVLVEKGLDFEREETFTTPSVEERAKVAPTLQVPTLVDGNLTLWDSAVIIDYLMSTYPGAPAPPGMEPLASDYVRATESWHDKLVLATLQTFGVSTTMVSQLQWSGVRHEENVHAARCAMRNQYLLDWFETQLVGADGAFVPGVISAQDILLTCVCQFIETRPLRLSWRSPARPRLASLVARMEKRPSVQQEAALWWEPGVTYATAAEVEWAKHKTIRDGLSFSEWTSQSAS
ncbi:glutathione S-transferase [Burkholderia sp. OAS925]|jgi:glutathione S-transferase|uniref:Glutathione S-transferase n=1 Tax=Paraburkholderia graminis TaxID=60548 RepID=A0ABD5CFP1_9BURK|nr:glutathione S-transferase family protein [Paraburkholderia graminis]MDQ0625603.1 glutathione S-transferase [Paraburkholderia graminis]MDR6204128.1 glutathione S-transferase [Paraburkholderia graminis]MDR6478148.1 glutathione S-transferase [Paraburkholderia graminis]